MIKRAISTGTGVLCGLLLLGSFASLPAQEEENDNEKDADRDSSTITEEELRKPRPWDHAQIPPLREEIAAGTEDQLQCYRFSLPGGFEGQELQLSIWSRAGKFGHAWGASPALPGYCIGVIAAWDGYFGKAGGLKQEGNTLQGEIAVYGKSYRLNARIDETRITGKYSILDDGQPKGGILMGEILKLNALRKQHDPLPQVANWPCWRGARGDGVGIERGKPIVNSPCAARVIWKSEDLIPAPYYEGSDQKVPLCDIQSGHASLIVAENRLYLSYFSGSGGKHETDKVNNAVIGGPKRRPRPIPRAMWEAKFSEKADDIVVCIDAQSGATIWRRVFKEAAPNITGWKTRVGGGGPNSKAASHLTPCYGDGMVFAKGPGGTVYALDALTGTERWRVSGLSNVTDSLVHADGVVATARGSTLIGMEATTGKELWKVEQALSSDKGSTTIRWEHDGKAYFIGSKGKCIEPRTGKVLWEIPAQGQPAVDAQHYLDRGNTLTCYRISLQKAEKIWELPATEGTGIRIISPVLYRGHLYSRVSVGPDKWSTICVNLESGKVLGRASGSKSFSSLIAGDGIVFNCNAASILWQNADPKNFVDLWPSGASVKLGGPLTGATTQVGTPETTAVYIDGRLFSRGFDGIVCYDLRP